MVTGGQSPSSAASKSFNQGSVKAPNATRKPCAIQKIAIIPKKSSPIILMNWCWKVPTRYPNTVKKSAISIIGAGRIGSALGRRLREQGWKIHSVVTRSQATPRRAVRSIAAGSGSGEVSPSVLSASVILISVPDSAISSVVNRLATFDATDLQSKTVLHTSGALSSKVLERLRPLGAAIGSIPPLQTFSGVGIPAMDGRIFALEGEPTAIRVARRISRSLGRAPLP